jgi:GNAT superfamily N-acetyltransferase
LKNPLSVKELSAREAQRRLDQLAEVLVDAVESGASVSFLLPFGMDEARTFWRRVIASVRKGGAVLLGAMVDDRLVGTVQMRLDTPPNQQHRVEIVKMLVHRDFRRHGVGRALMEHLEEGVRRRGRVLMVLDTLADSPASRLYESVGFTCAGTIPGYANLPLGGRGDTSVYYKQLR